MKRPLAKSRKMPILALTALAALTSFSDANAEGWTINSSSDPAMLNSNYNTYFDSLLPAAELAESARPWSGSFWPSRKGGIAYRWQTGEKPWSYTPPDKETVKSMTPEQLSALSPAEKLDILRGDDTYRTVKSAMAYSESGRRKLWTGICNGYSQASVQIEEPGPVVLERADGVKIPFGSGDLKALASFYTEDAAGGKDFHDNNTRRLGVKCDVPGLFRPQQCRKDVNAGAFHIAITNQIGSIGEAVIADVWRGRQVWQHPIYGYSFEKVAERPASSDAGPGAVREVHVKMKLFMGNYTDPTWETNAPKTKVRSMSYWVEIDGNGNIVGGKYVFIGSGAVDYLWVTETPPFQGGYELLGLKLKEHAPPVAIKPTVDDQS